MMNCRIDYELHDEL